MATICVLRDAPDGATVYVDLCIDSGSGVSCHNVDSQRGRVLNLLEKSLLCLIIMYVTRDTQQCDRQYE